MGEIDPEATVQCGKDALDYYHFDKIYRNLNHGSFGTYPRPVGTVLGYWEERTEKRPDEFIRYEYPRWLDVSREALARYVNAPLDTCVMVVNATTAVNTVLRNLVFRPGDVIITFATIYPACEKTVGYICETTALEARRVRYTYPVTDDDICDAFEELVQRIRGEGKEPKIALFDTIVSQPGVRMPFERLTKLCKQHDIFSLIDGAHGIGHIPLDLTALDADFFVSNCHKWLDVPRGCAIFYVPLRNQHLMRSTLPTSIGLVVSAPSDDGEEINNPLPRNNKSPFVANFEYIGTQANSPYLCVPAALEWRNRLTWRDKRGDEAHMAYCRWLAKRSGEIVSTILGTEVLSNADPATGRADTLGECNFSNVRLPLDTNALFAGDSDLESRFRAWAEAVLLKEYSTFFAMRVYAGAWWVRLSAQVYLTEEDFEWAGNALKEVCRRAELGEWKANALPII